MRNAALLDRSRTALVLIDLQEGYRPALHRWDRVAAASTVLVRGAAMLDVPLLVTEQYPRGLGHTAAEVASHFPPQLTITEKMSMSCCGAAAFLERLRETRRTQVLIAGIETHACVNQTVHDLIAAGYKPAPLFKEILAAVEDAQLEGQLHTQQEALEFVRSHYPATGSGNQS